MKEYQGITRQVTMQSAAGATGNGTTIELDGMEILSMQVSGTFVGTVTWEVTTDGTNYVGALAFKPSDGSTSLTATAAGVWNLPCYAYKRARARVSAWTSGTITVVGRAQAFTFGQVLT